jgi:hypothetical protein
VLFHPLEYWYHIPKNMMPHHFHPSPRYEESSIDDSSSVDDDDFDCEEGYPSVDAQPTFINEHSDFRGGEHCFSMKCRNAIKDLDDLSPRSLKRHYSDTNADRFSSQTHVDPNILCPSQAANISGSDAISAMKNGQKLIGELHKKKNEVCMNAILCEASCEGFMKSLAFPNRSKWIIAKVPI